MEVEQRPWHPQRGHDSWQPVPRLWRKCGHLCSALSEAHADPLVLCDLQCELMDVVTSEGIVSSRFSKRHGLELELRAEVNYMPVSHCARKAGAGRVPGRGGHSAHALCQRLQSAAGRCVA